MNKRQWFGRYRANRCVRHNVPLVPAITFDGSFCPFGCRHLNLIRYWALSLTQAERRERCR